MKIMHEGAAAALYPSTQAVTPTAASAFTSAALGLDGLKIRTPALVAGLLPARDGREHSTLLRLLEIGFVPGESVQVLARGLGVAILWRCGWGTPRLRYASKRRPWFKCKCWHERHDECGIECGHRPSHGSG